MRGIDMPYKKPLTKEQREHIRDRRRNWWGSLSDERKEEISEKKRQTYWNTRKQVPVRDRWNGKQTLCWDCQRAVKECPWSANFEPVPGWDAEPTLLMADYRPVQSFHVKACPLFEPDP